MNDKIKQKLFLVHYIKYVIYMFYYVINGLINIQYTYIHTHIYIHDMKNIFTDNYYVKNDKSINIENDIK